MRAGIASRSVVNQLSCQSDLTDMAGNRDPRRDSGSGQEDLARKSYSSTRSYTPRTVTLTDEVRGALIHRTTRDGTCRPRGCLRSGRGFAQSLTTPFADGLRDVRGAAGRTQAGAPSCPPSPCGPCPTRRPSRSWIQVRAVPQRMFPVSTATANTSSAPVTM
jgi:hypothetical protein